jgi:hypothetical protein
MLATTMKWASPGASHHFTCTIAAPSFKLILVNFTSRSRTPLSRNKITEFCRSPRLSRRNNW